MASENKFEEHDALSFSIGEVAKMLGVEAHTIRFWEKTFRIAVPRSNSNRRCYTRSDVTLLKKIQRLVHNDGLSLHSAYHQLMEEGHLPDLPAPAQEELSLPPNPGNESAAPEVLTADAQKPREESAETESPEWIRKIQKELRSILALLRG
ncbi:MAG: MerR family transcriptional regulator [Spirochaetota bacterium]|nr:MerR family transcriptional regulator [Spirochaetota bacterium]